jgi:rhamnosyl/mannosyltransferase
MRVCHLAKFYPPATGGIETHVQTLVRAQADLGARVQVLCVNHRDRRGRDVTWQAFAWTPTERESDGAVQVVRLGRRASLSRLDLCPDLPGLLSGLRRADVDVLHLHNPNPTMVLALAWARPAVPLVITHHSDVINQRLLHWGYRPFERMVYRRAAGILATSPGYIAGSPLLQEHAAKLETLPLGLDLAPFLEPSLEAQGHAARLRQEHGEPLWLAVSRLVYYKGLHNAVQALATVPGKLLVIGDGPLAEPLQEQARRLGVAERIIWQGRSSAEELVGAYHAATALWFPSNARSEGFGLVQVEAMASGCPVINSAVPASGVAWVCPHEETGLTTPVDDAEALARCARRLLEEPGLRQRLADNGRRRACAEFDHRRMAQRSLEIYQHVLHGQRRGARRG